MTKKIFQLLLVGGEEIMLCLLQVLEISSYTSIHSTDVRVLIVGDLLLAKPEPVNVKD